MQKRNEILDKVAALLPCELYVREAQCLSQVCSHEPTLPFDSKIKLDIFSIEDFKISFTLLIRMTRFCRAMLTENEVVLGPWDSPEVNKTDYDSSYVDLVTILRIELRNNRCD
jgi:hypothetical protein